MRFSLASRRRRIDRPVHSTGDAGEVVTSWQEVAAVWSERENTAADDRIATDKRLAETTSIVRIRHSSEVADVDAGHRVVEGDEILDVIAAVPVPGDRPRRIDLYCKAGS